MVKVLPDFVLLMLVVVYMVKVLSGVSGADVSDCIHGEGTSWCERCCC